MFACGESRDPAPTNMVVLKAEWQAVECWMWANVFPSAHKPCHRDMLDGKTPNYYRMPLNNSWLWPWWVLVWADGDRDFLVEGYAGRVQFSMRSKEIVCHVVDSSCRLICKYSKILMFLSVPILGSNWKSSNIVSIKNRPISRSVISKWKPGLWIRIGFFSSVVWLHTQQYASYLTGRYAVTKVTEYCQYQLMNYLPCLSVISPVYSHLPCIYLPLSHWCACYVHSVNMAMSVICIFLCDQSSILLTSGDLFERCCDSSAWVACLWQ